MKVLKLILVCLLISLYSFGQKNDTIIYHYLTDGKLYKKEKFHNGLLHGDSAIIWFVNGETENIENFINGKFVGFSKYKNTKSIVLKEEINNRFNILDIQNKDSLELYFAYLKLENGKTIPDTIKFKNINVISYMVDGLYFKNSSGDWNDGGTVYKGSSIKDRVLNLIKWSEIGGKIYLKNIIIKNEKNELETIPFKIIYFD